jgi:outer membrane protein
MNRAALLALLLSLTATTTAAEPLPIGYVDMQRVFEESTLGQQANARLQEQFGPRQQAFDQEEQAIRQLQQNLARDQALMSQAELDKRQQEIQQRIGKLQQEATAAQQELAQARSKLGSEILAPARTAVAEVAKERKIGMVFEQRQAGMLYGDDALDLTGAVVEQLNKQKAN